MAAIESRDLIEDYFKEVKDRYPGISFEKFTTICKAPFMFFRKAMEAPDFPLVHVKYFGKFVVYPGNAKKIIDLMGIFLRSGRITQEQFDDRTKDLKVYIQKYECENQNPPSSQGEETPD
jgi:hypothetical protein